MNTAIALLTLALSLLQAVNASPTISQDLKDRAVVVANMAISYSTDYLEQAGNPLTNPTFNPAPISGTPSTNPVVNPPVAQSTSTPTVPDPFKFNTDPTITEACTSTNDGVICTFNLVASTNYPSNIKVQFSNTQSFGGSALQYQSSSMKTAHDTSWTGGSGVYYVLITATSDQGTLTYSTRISG